MSATCTTFPRSRRVIARTCPGYAQNLAGKLLGSVPKNWPLDNCGLPWGFYKDPPGPPCPKPLGSHKDPQQGFRKKILKPYIKPSGPPVGPNLEPYPHLLRALRSSKGWPKGSPWHQCGTFCGCSMVDDTTNTPLQCLCMPRGSFMWKDTVPNAASSFSPGARLQHRILD